MNAKSADPCIKSCARGNISSPTMRRDHSSLDPFSGGPFDRPPLRADLGSRLDVTIGSLTSA